MEARITTDRASGKSGNDTSKASGPEGPRGAQKGSGGLNPSFLGVLCVGAPFQTSTFAVFAWPQFGNEGTKGTVCSLGSGFIWSKEHKEHFRVTTKALVGDYPARPAPHPH